MQKSNGLQMQLLGILQVSKPIHVDSPHQDAHIDPASASLLRVMLIIPVYACR